MYKKMNGFEIKAAIMFNGEHLQKWCALMENICNTIQSQDIPLRTSSRGASQVGQPHTTSPIAQPQTTSQVQLPHGSRRLTQSNASCAPSRNSSQPQDEDVDENCELDDGPIAECEVGITDESGVHILVPGWYLFSSDSYKRVAWCGSTCSASPRFNVADEEERMRDKETIHKLEDMMHAQAVEMSTLKEQVAFMMRHMSEVTRLQVGDGCNGPFDQASPHAHQRSSQASHDIECSNGGNRTV